MDRIVDYDRNAKLFDHRHGDILSESGVEQLIQAASLVPPGRILDIGAGNGRTSIPFSEHGFRVFAIDHSVGMLRRVQEKDRTEHVVRIRGVLALSTVADSSLSPCEAVTYDLFSGELEATASKSAVNNRVMET